jgi:hypothetical protein
MSWSLCHPCCPSSCLLRVEVHSLFSLYEVAVFGRIRTCISGVYSCINTDYGLYGPGSSPGGEQDFPPVQTGPGAHQASCKMGTGSFPGVNCGRGVLLTTHPVLVPRSWKSRAITVPTLWATSGL